MTGKTMAGWKTAQNILSGISWFALGFGLEMLKPVIKRCSDGSADRTDDVREKL